MVIYEYEFHLYRRAPLEVVCLADSHNHCDPVSFDFGAAPTLCILCDRLVRLVISIHCSLCTAFQLVGFGMVTKSPVLHR